MKKLNILKTKENTRKILMKSKLTAKTIEKSLQNFFSEILQAIGTSKLSQANRFLEYYFQTLFTLLR